MLAGLTAAGRRRSAIAGQVKQIPGWTDASDLGILVDLVDGLPDGAQVVEVGVYMGRSLATMALAGAGRGLTFTGIDKFSDEPGDDWPEEKRNLSWQEYVPGFEAPTAEKVSGHLGRLGVAGVTLLKGRGDELAQRFPDGSLDMVFIDASHDYESVRREIAAYLPKLKGRHVIAGDDFGWEGVARAVREAFGERAVTRNGKIWQVVSR
jgi:predicted O-methyltransferase YrrM